MDITFSAFPKMTNFSKKSSCQYMLDNDKKYFYSHPIFFPLIFLFLERAEKRKEGGGKKNIHIRERHWERHIHRLPPAGAQLGPGIKLETEAVPLTRIWTWDPLINRLTQHSNHWAISQGNNKNILNERVILMLLFFFSFSLGATGLEKHHIK